MNKLPQHLFVSHGDMYDTRKANWHLLPPLRKDYDRFGRGIDNTIALRAAIRNPYAWPGGYEIVFITSDGAILCNACVRKEYRSISWSVRNNAKDGWRVAGIGLENELEETEYCDHCNRVIHQNEEEVQS